MVWVPGGRRRAVCMAASWRLRSSHPATIRCRARIRSLRITRVGKTTTVVPTSVQGGPLSAGSFIWSKPVPIRAMTVQEPTYWASTSPGEGVAMRVVDRPADTAIGPWTDDDGGVTPPSGAGSLWDGAGPGRGPDVVGLRSRASREGAGRLGPSPSPPDRRGRPPPGLVKGLSTAFGLCASGKPRTPDPLTRTSGIGTASGMLWLLRGWPA